MLLSEEDMFSWVTEMAFEVYCRRFCTAPRLAAMLEMLLIAVLTSVSAVVLLRSNTWLAALLTLLQQKPAVRLPSTLANETLSVSDAPEPTWNTTLALLLAVPSSRLMPLNCEVFC